MLISLFNYPAGSHGRAVIKRKFAKMNGVRVLQLDTVMSALWDTENTCEFWEDWQAFGKQIPLNIWPKSQQENYNGLTHS